MQVDSDDDWEEEEPGESLSGSEVCVTITLQTTQSCTCRVALKSYQQQTL